MMMQDIKAGFRRLQLQNGKFEDQKRKNMDRYFSQVVNGKKKKHFEELGWRQEMGGHLSTVKQVTERVQGLMYHVGQNNGVVDGGFRSREATKRKRNRIKFTEAGFPIHNYLNELHDERERKELDKKRTKLM